MNPKHMTDTALEFVISDLNAAISANPENFKVDQYLFERAACREEQRKRHVKRVSRKMMRDYLHDPLTVARASRRWINNGEFAQDKFRSAAFMLYWNT